MDLARLRQQVQLRHDDNAGQGTFALPTGELLAQLGAIEAAEALRIYDGESAGIYSSYANLGDDDLTQDAIELRDMWLRFTAALAALQEAP